MNFLQNFNSHYLFSIWKIGLVFGIILLANYIYNRIKDKQFEKQQQLKKLQQQQILLNKSKTNSL